MGWATLVDVVDITRNTRATAEHLAMAASVIEIYSNRTVAASGTIGARDKRWLVTAECWQAAWLASQFGYDSRIAAESVTQDGVIVQHRGQHEEDLAPLAARALKNLSWKGSNSKRVPNIDAAPRRRLMTDAEFLNENSDALAPWQAM